jgi:hypothetical protein
MKTLDLARKHITLEELLKLAFDLTPRAVPVGTAGNSPAIYRWVEGEGILKSRKGRQNENSTDGTALSSLPGLGRVRDRHPSDKSLGYDLTSLPGLGVLAVKPLAKLEAGSGH